MRKGTSPQQFTEEEKKAILYDYLTSGLSQKAIAFKYNLGDRSMLSNWLRNTCRYPFCVFNNKYM